LKGHWNDPDIADRFRAFFLETYKVQFALERDSPMEEAVPKADGEGVSFHLGLDNLPEEHLPPEQFMFLVKTRQDIIRWLNAPKLRTDDPCVAAVVLTRCYILRVSLFFVEHILWYLLFDGRFHPDRVINVNAIGAFSFESTEQDLRQCFNAMTCFAVGCNLLFPDQQRNATFASEINLLHEAGDVFFDTLQSAFPIREVGKCRKAFTRLMINLGTDLACDDVENYIRRRKTLYREMVAFERNGGRSGHETVDVKEAVQEACSAAVAVKMAEISAKIDAQEAALAENSRTIANMDRRQRTVLAFMKTTVSCCVQMFRPGRSSPSREEVGEVLLPDDRFACLKNINEPHSSQLRAVIRMTKDHPIERSEGKKCVFTLASAARAVWDRDHEKWEKIPGSFDTYEQLKAACYGLAKNSKTNPFYYAK